VYQLYILGYIEVWHVFRFFFCYLAVNNGSEIVRRRFLPVLYIRRRTMQVETIADAKTSAQKDQVIARILAQLKAGNGACQGCES